MQWNRFTIDTTTEAVDLISSMLDELGVEGIEIEDHVPLTESETKGMFIDILPDLGPDDGKAKVSFYLDVDVDPEGLLEQVKEGLEELKMFVNIGEGTITESQTEDKDWMNNWKEYFKPFTVDDILIKPTWETVPEEHKDKLMIEIDPGTAFGTGTHETTQLCIRQIRKWLKAGDTVLDVGTGSGILAIAALKLGASTAFGTDLDENAVTAAVENAEVNGITQEQFQVIAGNIIDDEAVQAQAGLEKYDVAVANILAPVIIMLQGEIAKHIKHGGMFITSGIINTWEERVLEAFAGNDEFEVVDVAHQGEWVAITAKRR